MRNLFLLTFVSALFLTGCSEGACCGGSKLVQTKDATGRQGDNINKTPIAIISKLPTSTSNCRSVEASSELSYDEDGAIQSYIWSVDDTKVSEDANLGSILPCEDSQSEYQVCLTVIDDEGASSLKTCQSVLIVEQRTVPNPTVPAHVIPTIEIPDPYRDGNDHVFDICEQTFDGHIVESYHWIVTKHFIDGATATHTNDTCQKRIYAKDKEFESVDVTLTITYTDGHSSTTTSSYIQSDDAQTLDDD